MSGFPLCHGHAVDDANQANVSKRCHSGFFKATFAVGTTRSTRPFQHLTRTAINVREKGSKRSRSGTERATSKGCGYVERQKEPFGDFGGDVLQSLAVRLQVGLKGWPLCVTKGVCPALARFRVQDAGSSGLGFWGCTGLRLRVFQAPCVLDNRGFLGKAFDGV